MQEIQHPAGSVMADLLAAASLMVTVVTILYSLWYPEIANEIGRRVDDKAANRSPAFRAARAMLVWKTIPLFLVSATLFAINIPDTLAIIGGISFHARYSAVKTAFVVVTIVILYLALHTFVAVSSLWGKVMELNPKRGDYNNP
jgi:hypothetical protein